MDAADRMAQELARTLMQTGLRFREVTLSPTHDAFPHVLRKTCTGHQTAAQYTRDTSASLQAITGPALAVLLAGCKTTDAALRARFDALTQYDEAVKRTSRRVAAVDKLKTTRAIQATKVDAALERLAAAKQQEGQDRESLRSISVILKARMPTFRERVVCDTAQMLQEIAEVQRQAAQREWRLWQTLYHELDTVC
ncbi:hypothetical protein CAUPRSCDRAFT_12143 [Caulochytrium protostelioides]|nr:hypothetical protein CAUPRSCDRAFT_12143 [Caulochytrium protostelioides]